MYNVCVQHVTVTVHCSLLYRQVEHCVKASLKEMPITHSGVGGKDCWLQY